MFPMECTGFRFYAGMNMEFDSVPNLHVEFRTEENNNYDAQAVAIYLFDQLIGYVPRYYSPLFRIWMSRFQVIGVTTRIMGSIGSPKLQLQVSVSNNTAPEPIASSRYNR